MAKVDVEILLRVPEGEELTDERIEALEELGFDDAAVVQHQPGRLTLSLRLDEADWEDEAEARAEEVIEELPDVDVVDIKLAD